MHVMAVEVPRLNDVFMYIEARQLAKFYWLCLFSVLIENNGQ